MKAFGAVWRTFRALPGRAQGVVVAAVVVALVVAAAVAGPGTKPTSTARAGGGPVPTTESPASTRPHSTSSPAPAPASSASAVPATAAAAPNESPGACHVRGTGLYVLPDPACTPGVTNPEVTQADISSTICASGWTATIRPPESYTEPLKLDQIAAYGETGSVSSYEEDHLISLELGGSPRDPRNLWPEPGPSPNPKDAVENAARRAVCDGQISLASAQQGIATNWVALGEQLGVTSTAPAQPSGAPPPTSTAVTSAGACHPTTSTGHCYKAGEYCSNADHGMTGTDASGDAITCEDVNGTWRWE